MRRSVKVATPATAFTVRVPLSVAPPGFVPSDMVTGAVDVDIRFPPASCTSTFTSGEMLAPAATFRGCTANASREAAPGTTVTSEEPERPSDVATIVAGPPRARPLTTPVLETDV